MKTCVQVLKNAIKLWQKHIRCILPKGDAYFVCQMKSVLEVYKRPYDPEHPVICLDETSK